MAPIFYQGIIMQLHPHTFGNSRTAEILVEILNEYGSEKYTEKVSHFVSRNYILINNINDIKDEKTKSIVGQLLIDNVNNSNMILTDKIKSFMKNLIIGKIKAKLIRQE